jgi:hypothetical protein
MEKIEFNEELDRKVDELMKEEMLPSTCQFYVKEDSKMVKHASGVFVETKNFLFVLTASHVVEELSDSKPLFVKIHGGFVSMLGLVQQSDLDRSKNADVAYIKLNTAIHKDLRASYKFIPISKFRHHPVTLDASNYCVFGYPTESVEKIEGKEVSKAMGYVVRPAKEKVFNYYKLDSLGHYVMEFKGAGISIETGQKSKVISEPYGLSGCGLWYILVSKNAEGNFEIDYRLIGIMTEFRKGKYHCLIGNKINIILKAFTDFDGIKFRLIKVYNNA